MRKYVAILAFSFAVCASSDAPAFVLGGTNLPLISYPDPQCTKPYGKPTPPDDTSNQPAVSQYNLEVAEYNNRLRTYNSCIRTYLENADNDIKRIQEKEDDALKSAKAP